MTVSSQASTATFVGNGVATAFPLPFRFFNNSDIRAYFIDSVTGAATQMVLGSDYTLIGAGEPEVDGNALSLLTTTAPLASMRGLYVERVMQQVQGTNIVNQGQFFASTHEDVFDRLTMLIQQANANSQGAIRVAIGDPEPNRLPPALQRAGKIMTFSSSGDPVATVPLASDAAGLAVLLAAPGGASLIGYGATTVGAAISSAESAISDLSEKSDRVLYAADFNLLGDGSDETAKVQAAFTAASVQGKRLIGDRTKSYKITGQITGGSNCAIEDFYIDASVMTGTKHSLVFQGALSSSSLLTGDVTANAFVIPVVDGSIFSADEWVLLTVDTSYYPYSTYNVARGEWVQIRSVSGNNINITTPLVQAYTTATGATLRKCSFVENVLLDNVRITGSGVANSNERGVSFRFARFFEVRSCVFTNLDQYACEISACIKFSLHHNRFRGTFYNGVTGTIFYAVVLLDACQYFTVHDNQGSRSRHLVVTTAVSAGQGRWGQVMFGIVHDNVAEDCMAGGAGRSFAYEMHGTGQHLLWANNIANGCYSFMRIEGGSDSQVIGGGCNGYAFQGLIIGGTGNTVRNIKITGVHLNNYTAEVAGGAAIRFETTTLLEGVTVDKVTANKVSVGSDGFAFSMGSSTTARNNVIRGLHANAGDVESTGSGTAFSSGIVGGVAFEDCDFYGWRTPYNMGTASKISVNGGNVGNFSTGATGWAFYSNGDRNIFRNVGVRNINTAARLDTLSTNNLVANNTFTDCVIPTPSNSGTGNVVAPNFTV